MAKGRVLVVGSNATRIELRGGGTGPTGQYLNETVVPAMALIEAGYDLVLATPSGAKPHIDAASNSPQHFGGDQNAYQRAKAFYADHPSMNEVSTLRSVIERGLQNYLGAFVPGGQAPAVDLMQDADAGEIFRHFHDQGKPTAFLCHGPIATIAAMPRAREFRAALIAGDEEKAAELARGWPYAGYEMTVFSGSEEKWVENENPSWEALLHHARCARDGRGAGDDRRRLRAARGRRSRTHHRAEPALGPPDRGQAHPGARRHANSRLTNLEWSAEALCRWNLGTTEGRAPCCASGARAIPRVTATRLSTEHRSQNTLRGRS